MTESPGNQPGPYPGGYPPPPPQPYAGYPPPPTGPKNGLGIAALVIGIFALLTAPSVVGGVILGILALVLGIVGRGRVKRGEATNRGVATAGVWLGILGIVAGLAFIPLYGFVWKEIGGEDFISCMNKAGSDTVKQQQCQDQFQQHINQEFSVTPTPTP